jgi:hypothetical protein
MPAITKPLLSVSNAVPLRFELAFELIVDQLLPAANPFLWEDALPF